LSSLDAPFGSQTFYKSATVLFLAEIPEIVFFARKIAAFMGNTLFFYSSNVGISISQQILSFKNLLSVGDVIGFTTNIIATISCVPILTRKARNIIVNSRFLIHEFESTMIAVLIIVPNTICKPAENSAWF
jgi:hypothetical protein